MEPWDAADVPFPLTFSVTPVEGVWVVHATAARAVDLVDILARGASGHIVVLDICTSSFMHEDLREWEPSLIAAEQGVDCVVHDIGALAAGVVGLSAEALVLRSDDLQRFLTGWSPYELTLVDVPEPPSPERVDEIALVVGTADDPLLPALDSSRLYYSGHDDYYIAVETADPAVPGAVVRRLFALLAGELLGSDAREPGEDTVDALLTRNPHWAAGSVEVTAEAVTIGLAATPRSWRISDPRPEHADFCAVYNIADAMWRLVRP